MRTAALGALAGGTGVLPSVFAGAPRAMAAGTFVATDPDLHLLRRATYGPTTASLRSIERMGPGAWLEQQLDPSSIRDSFVDDLLASRYPNLSLSVGKAYSTLNGSWDLMFDLGQAAIVRAAWSERQLLEVMVDFWANHLNVTNPSDNVWWSRHDYDRRVIRKHALGKFSHMLKASATHPAMMTYLNNADSTKDNPNENYGRELLELHSLGVDGGYDEEDMRQSTLVMTGFGISWDTGEFEYDKDNHYVGPVSVVNWSSPNGSANRGYDVGLDYVNHLAHHRSTAERIASKLCERFVSDDPPRALVDKLAQTYLHHDTDISEVLRELFRSKAFKGSIGAKVRRPMEDVVATLRILRIKPDDDRDGRAPGPLLDARGPEPRADGVDAAQRLPGRRVVLEVRRRPPEQLEHARLARRALVAGHAAAPRPEGDRAAEAAPRRRTAGSSMPWPRRLVFRKLEAVHRDAVLAFLGKAASDPLSKTDAAVTWRLPYLVALILDSPYHGIR